MHTSLPLSECSADEILARTVYRIIQADYKVNPEQYDRPATRLLDLALNWREDGLEMIADKLAQVAHHIAGGGTVASWRTLHTAIGLGRPHRVMNLRKPKGR